MPEGLSNNDPTKTATPGPVPAAGKPFHFTTSAHLLRIGQEKATTLAQLLAGLRNCPEESIFQHTFRTLEEHHFASHGFSNDFAQWAFTACNEPGLGERLAGVDVREFTSLPDLRQCIVEIVEQYIRRNPRSTDRVAREPFFFCSAEIVVLPTPFVASNLPEFLDGLARVTVHSIHHHFIEGRLRLKLASNDFSFWLQTELGLADTARRINRIDIYTATLEEVRRQIIGIAQQAAA